MIVWSQLAKIAKARTENFGAWLTLIMGITTFLFAVPMLILGLQLMQLGGSRYYALAGAAFTGAAVLILREQRAGYRLYIFTFACTIMWAFWEVGPDLWGLLPRLLTFAVITAVSWVFWPQIDRRLQPPTTVKRKGLLHLLGPWQNLGTSVGAVAIVGTLSFL